MSGDEPKQRVRRLRRLASLFAVVLLSLGAASCGQREPGNLPLLLAEPITDVQPDSGVERSRLERDDGTSLGMPVFAAFQVVFLPAEGRTTAEVRDELIESAQQLGWEFENLEDLAGDPLASLRSRKQSEGNELLLSVSIRDNDMVGLLLYVA